MKYEKKFTLIITDNGDGSLNFSGENIGFNGLELIGLLDMKKVDVIDQMNGRYDFKRYAVNEKGERTEIVKEGEESEAKI